MSNLSLEENAMNQSFTPVRVGRYTLPNRLVMAPMTRSRAKFDGTPGELAAEYYSQRASLGLIVTEGSQPSDDGQGYLATPGIYSQCARTWKTAAFPCSPSKTCRPMA